ncbi:MAG TPA: hypothetical protein VKU90_14170 [Caulobacteraceae bacterium]|nr:hypothetical protein [Caulobacteraceae bacterium]
MTRASSMVAAAAVLIATAALAGRAEAAGSCATFQVIGNELNLDYNPFSPQPVNRPFQLTVTRLDPSVTGVRFILVDHTPSNGGSRIGPGGPRDYDITWLGNTGQPVFFASPQAVNGAIGATASFGSGPHAVVSVPFILHIPQGQPVAASRQDETIEIRFQCSAGPEPQTQELQYDNRVSIHLTIPRYFGAYVGSLGHSHGEIDFGTLRGDPGSSDRYVSVTAVSTVPYSINIDTDNGSMLRRSHEDDDGIPYSMTFDSIPVRDHAKLRCPATQSSLGSSAPLAVRLDDTHAHDLPAGAYRDTIRLTFTPTDGVQRGRDCEAE